LPGRAWQANKLLLATQEEEYLLGPWVCMEIAPSSSAVKILKTRVPPQLILGIKSKKRMPISRKPWTRNNFTSRFAQIVHILIV
jgi:hypothetical protein